MTTALLPSMLTVQPNLDLTRLVDGTRFDPWLPSRPARRFRYRVLSAEYAAGSSTGVLASAGVDVVARLQPAGGYPFIGLKLSGVYTDPRFLIQMEWHVGSGRRYATQRMPAICFLGSGRLPFLLPAPIQLGPGARLRFLATDDGYSANNTIRISLHGAEVASRSMPFFPARTYQRVESGSITWDFAATSAAHPDPDTAAPAANLATGAPKLVDPDYDFEATHLTIQAVGDFLLQFRTTDGGDVFDTPIHGASLAASLNTAAITSIESPYLFPIGGELYVEGGTTLHAEVTDLTGAASNNIQIVLHGRLLMR